MAENTTTEKVICMPSENRCDPMAWMAMLNNGSLNGNNFWGFIMTMWMMRFMGTGYGYGEGENYNSRAIATLQDTVNQNHLNQTVLDALGNNQAAIRDLAQTFHCDINSIQTGLSAISSAIQGVGGQLGLGIESVKNAVALGDNGIIRQICDCCCSTKMAMADGFNQTQRTIMEGFNSTQREVQGGFNQTQRELLNNGYQTQLATERQTSALISKMDTNHAADQLQQCQNHGSLISRIDQLANGVTQGFASIGYQMAADKAEIIQDNTAKTQKVLDAICQQSTQALRDALADKDRQLQTQTIIASLKKDGKCGCGV